MKSINYKSKKMNNKRGASMLLIVVLVALIAIPYFYGGEPRTNDETAGDTDNNTSWFKVFVPAQNTNIIPNTAPKDEPTVAKPVVEDKVETKTEEIVEIDPNLSQYSKLISITSLSRSSSLAQNESITIKNISKDKNIPITNFVIETYEKESFRIPKGYELPGLPSSVLGEIILKPSDYVVIHVGQQEKKINFRENLCTGYFDQVNDYGGALSHSCPKPDISKRLDFSDDCIKKINSIPSCRSINTKDFLDYTCNEFVNEHYNYAGCVRDYSGRTDFYSKKWVMWMQRGSEFFRNSRGLVTIKDSSGKVVTEYRY